MNNTICESGFEHTLPRRAGPTFEFINYFSSFLTAMAGRVLHPPPRTVTSLWIFEVLMVDGGGRCFRPRRIASFWMGVWRGGCSPPPRRIIYRKPKIFRVFDEVCVEAPESPAPHLHIFIVFESVGAGVSPIPRPIKNIY